MILGGGHTLRFGVFISGLIISSVFAAIAVGGVAQALNVRDPKYGNPPNQAKAQIWGDDFCAYWDSRGGGYVGDMVWITAGDGSKDIYAYEGDTTAPVLVNAGGKYCGAHDSSIQVYGHYYDDLGTITNDNVNRNPRIAYPKQAAGTYFHAEKNSFINISSLGAGDHTLCITLDTVYGGLAPEASPNACSPITLHIRSKWTINGQSYIRKSTSQNNSQGTIIAQPGDTLYWSHDMRSSANMDRDVYYNVDKTGFSGPWAGWNAQKEPLGWARGTAGQLFVTAYPPNSAYSVKGVTQDDVGKGDMCQRIAWKDGRWDYGDWLWSSWACANVPYNFNLIPSIDPLGREFGDQGGTIPTVTAKVKNDGPTKSYDGTNWQLSTIIVKPGGSVPGALDTRQDGCAYYGNKCVSFSGSGPTFIPPDSTQVAQLVNQQIGDLEVGSQLCYGLSVAAYNQGLTNASGWWRHSAPQCVVIGKRPKVQVWGGDLTVGRRFNDDVTAPSASSVDVSTSTKDNGTKTFGSWIEYGIFAPGEITGGSAAGLAGPTGNASNAQSDWSKLTFANSGHTADSGCTATGFGCYAKAGAMGIIPDVATRLAPGKVTDTPQLPNGALDSLSGTYYAAGDATITGGTIAKGKSVVIRAGGTVRITGDIHYTGDSMTSIADIPQVVIIANNIVINDNVSNVDAWLIANGASGGIYTCGDLKAILTSKVCDKQLTVNGPVMSKKLFLQRTAGSGTDTASGDPAEVLNLRADAYLWAISHSGGAGGIQTVDTHELAPRF